MKHSIKELYKIKGDTCHIYDANAVMFINHTSRHNAKNGDCFPILSRVNNGKPFRIYHSIGNKTDFSLGWMYGEKIWFDTEEELRSYYE